MVIILRKPNITALNMSSPDMLQDSQIECQLIAGKHCMYKGTDLSELEIYCKIRVRLQVCELSNKCFHI